MVGSRGMEVLHVEDVVVTGTVDEADLWRTRVVWKVVMVDTEMTVISHGRRGTAVDILDTNWDTGRRGQRGDVDVVTLTTHRLHLLTTTTHVVHQFSLGHWWTWSVWQCGCGRSHDPSAPPPDNHNTRGTPVLTGTLVDVVVSVAMWSLSRPIGSTS